LGCSVMIHPPLEINTFIEHLLTAIAFPTVLTGAGIAGRFDAKPGIVEDPVAEATVGSFVRRPGRQV
jgi:hypothetical protein